MEFILAGGVLSDQGHAEALLRCRAVLHGLFGEEEGERIRKDPSLRPLITPVVASNGQDSEAVDRLVEADAMRYLRDRGWKCMPLTEGPRSGWIVMRSPSGKGGLRTPCWMVQVARSNRYSVRVRA